MSYYRAGGLEPGDVPEIPFPDPLADTPTRTLNLMGAYGRWRKSREAPLKLEEDMGYYRAGGSPASETDVALGPDSGGSTTGHVLGEGRHYKRMNPANIHALRRSMRRLQAFGKLAKRYYTFTRPHAGGHLKMHRKRRK